MESLIFEENSNLRELSSNAFNGCDALLEVELPASLTSIADYTFYDCDGLVSVTFAENSKIERMGSEVFRSCNNLQFVEIPSSITEISYNAFRDCTTLATVEFEDNSNLAKLGYEAFYGCTSLESVTLPAALCEVGDSVFNSCTNLKSVIFEDGCNIEIIGSYMFAYCSSLESVDFGEGGELETIGSSAFYNCPKLLFVVIPTGVECISSYSFYGCSSLSAAIIPSTAVTLESSVFSGNSLLTVYVEHQAIPSGWNSYWNGSGGKVVWGFSGEEYTYSFETNGGNSIESITSSLPITLPEVTKSGWFFGGWFDNPEFEGDPINGIYYSQDKHELYARWLTEEEYEDYMRDGTSFEKAYIIKKGESMTVNVDVGGKYTYFEFTATEYGSYTFTSTGNYDTYGYLYNSAGSQITYNDDSGSGSNFSITRTLNAGETVYIGVRMYSSSTTGTFYVEVR